jgi:exodeoxyribonuclease VII small subunit
MTRSTVEINTLTYEEGIRELETIINGLESAQPSLEEAMTLFERGQALTHYLAGLLDQAELRVRLLSGEASEKGEGTP